ncbi:MAG: class I SAM-dependent methyltransferase [Elainellaceae cyanobacterium]
MEKATRPIESGVGNPALARLIAQRIGDRPFHRITFAEFMNLVLYHPLHGYYTGHQPNIGAQGDFVTSPHFGADFGELLAEQIAQMWHRLGHPSPFTVVEMGGGQGLLVRDILQYLHRHYFECFSALHYRVIEQSQTLVMAQQHRFAPIIERFGNLQWTTWDDVPPDSIDGCYLSNELVDSFPVHRVILQDGDLREIYVTVEQPSVPPDQSNQDSSPLPRFVEVVGDLSTPKIQDYFDRVGINLMSGSYPDGYRTEVNLEALDWMQTVSDRLHRGYVLTIDYGYSAKQYYSPARSDGTLQCYYQQFHHDDPYQYVGLQDLTAHVDFTALQRQGDRCGLQTVGFTQQGLFLMALGLGDRIAALSNPDPALNWTINDILRRREALHALINPMGLGNFGVLIQSKGLSHEETSQPLKGLNIPPLGV